MPKITLPLDKKEISEGIDFIQKVLSKKHIRGKALAEAMLISEETMNRLITQKLPEITNFDNNETIQTMTISIMTIVGISQIRISARGERLKGDSLELNITDSDDGFDEYDEEEIRNRILQSYKDKITYTRKGSQNIVKISAGNQEKTFAIKTLMAIISAIIVGAIFWPFVDKTTGVYICENILMPLQSIYLNALQLITAPAVFFSLMTATTKYLAFYDPGKICKKTMLTCMLTSIGSIVVSILTFKLLSPLLANYSGSLANFVYEKHEAQSIKDMVMDFVPSNMVDPFLKTDPMQLLFIAIICGIALNKVNEHTPALGEIAEALDKFFFTISQIISMIIPISVFFSVLLTMYYFDVNIWIMPLYVFIYVIAVTIIVAIGYLLIVKTMGRGVITTFLVKSIPHIKNALWAGSGISIIPDTIQFCKEKLGISKKVSAFTIPFGAVANLDGNCIYFCIAGLTVANLCGVNLIGSDILKIIFIVFVLSVGAPISAGSAMLSLALLMNQMGVSLYILSSLLVFNAFEEMIVAGINSFGDIAVTFSVARTENLVNMKTFRYDRK